MTKSKKRNRNFYNIVISNPGIDRITKSQLHNKRCQNQETCTNKRIRWKIVLNESILNGFYCM